MRNSSRSPPQNLTYLYIKALPTSIKLIPLGPDQEHHVVCTTSEILNRISRRVHITTGVEQIVSAVSHSPSARTNFGADLRVS